MECRADHLVPTVIFTTDWGAFVSNKLAETTHPPPKGAEGTLRSWALSSSSIASSSPRHTSTLVFGQMYYGRSKQLSKLLDVTSVPNEQNTGLPVIFVSGELVLIYVAQVFPQMDYTQHACFPPPQARPVVASLIWYPRLETFSVL